MGCPCMVMFMMVVFVMVVMALVVLVVVVVMFVVVVYGSDGGDRDDVVLFLMVVVVVVGGHGVCGGHFGDVCAGSGGGRVGGGCGTGISYRGGYVYLDIYIEPLRGMHTRLNRSS